MKGKVLAFVAAWILIGLLTAGCGATVPQEEHDLVVADLAACQAEVERVESEAQSKAEEAQQQAAAAEAQLGECQSELEATQAQSELEPTQAELADLQARVEEAALAAKILSVFMDLALSGEQTTSEDAMAAFLELSVMVQEAEDEELQEELAALALSQNLEQDGIDVVAYLLEKITALSEE